MSKPAHIPVRVSAFIAALECGVTVNKVKGGLKANGIAPGKDGKYSFREIVTALTSATGLEAKAKEAKWQHMIEEAELAKVMRQEKRGKLAPIELLKKYAEDIIVQHVQYIRHSSLSEVEKKQLIEQIRETHFSQNGQ